METVDVLVQAAGCRLLVLGLTCQCPAQGAVVACFAEGWKADCWLLWVCLLLLLLGYGALQTTNLSCTAVGMQACQNERQEGSGEDSMAVQVQQCAPGGCCDAVSVQQVACPVKRKPVDHIM